MKYKINIKSANKLYIDDYYMSEKTVEAEDFCEAVAIAMQETSIEKIENTYLPLRVTIDISEG